MKCFRCLQEVPDDAEVCPYCGQILKPVLKIDKSEILDPSSLHEGDMIKDRFEIRENLGSGGIGTVFKVYDTKFDVISIVKMLNREFCEDQEIRDRFFEEHRKVLEVDDENLVKYYEIDEYKGVPFIVSQYVDGINLRRVINAKKSKNPPFSLKEISPIFEGISRALMALHGIDSFHGDLKPENVIITASGVKVTDFAISKVLPPQDFVSVQLSLGDAYYYLSPEYITDPEKIDYRVDIYALGVILYEMLTGEIPKAEPAPPSTMNRDIDNEMDKVVLKAIEKDPEKRFCCVEEFFVAFSRAAGKDVTDQKILASLKKKKEKVRKRKEAEEERKAREKASESGVKTGGSLFDEDVIEEEEKQPQTQPRKRELLFEEELSGEKDEGEKKVETPRKKSALPVVLIILILLIAGGGAAFYFTSQGKKATTAEKAGTTSEKKVAVQKEKRKPAGMKKQKKETGNKTTGEKKVAAMTRPEKPKGTTGKNATASGTKPKKEKAQGQEKKTQSGKVPAKKEAKKEEKKETVKKVAVAKVPPCPQGMVYIPPGYFIYGSPPNDPFGGGAFDKYFGKTYLKGYCIDKYEYPNKKGVVPRSNVTYTEAYNLCKAAGKRLCTEAEWEKACKGPANTLFPFGSTFKVGVCNTVETGLKKIMPAGSYPGCKSGYGVYDLCGNLLEWTSTLYQNNFFITKGGSYKRTKGDSRCSARRPKPYYRKAPDLGFRCCKDASH